MLPFSTPDDWELSPEQEADCLSVGPLCAEAASHEPDDAPYSFELGASTLPELEAVLEPIAD